EVIYDCGAYETKVETWNENKHDWNEPIFSGSCEAPQKDDPGHRHLPTSKEIGHKPLATAARIGGPL
ncbi:unnamed protein product, partial [marine sediment metagenome]